MYMKACNTSFAVLESKQKQKLPFLLSHCIIYIDYFTGNHFETLCEAVSTLKTQMYNYY